MGEESDIFRHAWFYTSACKKQWRLAKKQWIHQEFFTLCLPSATAPTEFFPTVCNPPSMILTHLKMVNWQEKMGRWLILREKICEKIPLCVWNSSFNLSQTSVLFYTVFSIFRCLYYKSKLGILETFWHSLYRAALPKSTLCIDGNRSVSVLPNVGMGSR